MEIDCHNRPLLNGEIASVVNKRTELRSAFENFYSRFEISRRFLVILFFMLGK